MILRRLNESGLESMQRFLDSLTTDNSQAYPPFDLQDSHLTETCEPCVNFEPPEIVTRHDAGCYYYNLLDGQDLGDLSKDKGLWTWLALVHFESLCAKGRGGRLKPGAPARWIADVSNYQRYYRHLLAGPYMIYKAHADDPARASAVLCNLANRPGDIVEQLASRQAMVSNRGLIGAATLLYVDPETGKPKRGAGGKGPGSARRLATVYEQFDLTWDLYSLEPEDLVVMLPSEFDRFRPAPRAGESA